jgi:acetyl-CoA carboxylase biotin carboxylase subunit
MFKRILIANRGEIAVRIIRACREMDIETVAVYSKADKFSLHTQMADYAVCIGEGPAKSSYLNMENILSAAILLRCEAIHPGYGLLSENSSFAEMCSDCGIKFIGPDAKTIDLMGNKAKAKQTMADADVPVIPGSNGVVENVESAMKIAEKIGYPVMVKASLGGGGRGMRIVRFDTEMRDLFENAKAEAIASFGDGSLYIEKFIENPRHIEIQLLGDNYGNVVYLGERDCTIQRRNQKVIEESPSSVIDDDIRKKMGDIAVRAAKAVEYKGAGTIEFLFDKYKNFYFMEMNTRIQVEHPVTEMVTGVDLVKEQIKIANGDKLAIKQKDIKITGHAIECRINAEIPAKGFIPCPGQIENIHIPGGNGIRVDSCVYTGYTITPYYDSMIAKLIAYGATRDEAIRKMRSALYEFIVEGVETNIDFQLKILKNDKFMSGNYDTSFIKQEFGL